MKILHELSWLWETLGIALVAAAVCMACAALIGKAAKKKLSKKLLAVIGAAAFVGAIFVGVGAGVCVRAGGAPGGDDALAMSVSHLTGWSIERVYLLSDLIVLLLSLSYIPVRRIGFSLLTVILSGQIIGLIQKIPGKKTAERDAGPT